MRAGVASLLLAAWMIAPAAPGDAASRFASPACGATWRISAEPTPAPDTLYDVAIVSANDAWAVGLAGIAPQVEHWDGVSWTAVTAPGSGYLLGVNALAANDVWAVGHGWDGFPFIEHYDGAAWTVVDSPRVSGDLGDVAAVSSDDVWAVGTSSGAGLIEHWDGSAWSVVPGAASDGLGGVAALSSTEVWAVGSSGGQALAERWDGTTWAATLFRIDTALGDVDAISATDIWAVGSDELNHRPSDFSVHWDGSAWTEVPAPTEGLGMMGVAAIAPYDVWAVTITVGFVDQTGIEHWDGKKWRVVPSPNTSPVEPNYLFGIDATSAELWAVGGYVYDDEYDFDLREHLCPASVLDTGVEPVDTTVPFGNMVAWSLPSSDLRSHSIADPTGTELFDSGVRPPGSSFSFVFFAAGTYRVLDRVTGARSRVLVPIQATPPSGGLTTTFTITWAARTAIDPFRYDVQIMRPGSSVWQDWLIGQADGSLAYTPDAGVGTYGFRSRVMSTATGRSSGWSPIASIVVS
jgi:hypothetical protein